MRIKDLKYKSPNDKYVYNGMVYGLSHLRPYTIVINNRKVHISFSHYVFTDGKNTHNSIIYKNKKVIDFREFCLYRYEKLHQLRNIISRLTPNHRLMNNKNEWFFVYNNLGAGIDNYKNIMLIYYYEVSYEV